MYLSVDFGNSATCHAVLLALHISHLAKSTCWLYNLRKDSNLLCSACRRWYCKYSCRRHGAGVDKSAGSAALEQLYFIHDGRRGFGESLPGSYFVCADVLYLPGMLNSMEAKTSVAYIDHLCNKRPERVKASRVSLSLGVVCLSSLVCS